MIFDWKTELHRYRRYFVNVHGLSQRQDIRSFTSLTITFLTISVFGFLAIKPTFVIIAGLTKQLKENEEYYQKLQEKIGSLVKAQEEYSLNENRFYLIDQALPETANFPSLVFALEKEAEAASVQIVAFSIDKIELTEGAKTIVVKGAETPSFDFNATLTGDYENLKIFLGKLENLRRVIDLENVSFAIKKEAKQETFQLRLSFSGKANYYPVDVK